MTPCNPRTCPMKARIALLEGIILRGEPVPMPGLEEAIEAIKRGDWGPWLEFKRRGGFEKKGGEREQKHSATVVSGDRGN